MTQITLKTQIDQSKLNALLLLLNTWGIDAEINTTINESDKKDEDRFPLTFGLWENRDNHCITYDKNGIPKGHTLEEFSEKLLGKLSERYGVDFREL